MAGSRTGKESSERMRIAVCITTFRRPEGLTRLLGSVAAIEVPEGIQGAIRVVVVDNDEARTGEAAATGFDAPGWMAVEYACEAARGISQARNRALREALGEGSDRVDAVAFVDDDEVVERGWLAALMRARDEFDADVVGGPALARFEGEIPGWDREGVFFQVARRATGATIDRAATHNVLIGSGALRAVGSDGVWFDEALGLVGGEDELLFRRMHAAGFRIVWCDEAIAHEMIPAERTTVRWVLRRAQRMGTTSAYVSSALGGGMRGAIVELGIGGYRVLKGAVVWMIGGLGGNKHTRISGLRHICYGSGHVSGVFGHRPAVYREGSGA